MQQRFTSLVILVQILFLCGLPAAAASTILSATDPPEALDKGYVKIKRGAEYLPARLRMEIQTGDRIEITHRNAGVTLTLPDGQSKPLKFADSPYEFRTEAAGLSDAFLKLADALGLGKWRPGKAVGVTTVSASTGKGTRGAACGKGTDPPPLCIPADDVEATVKLAAGERGLHIRWRGGKAPYRLSIQKDGKEIQAAKDIKGCELTLPKRHWQPGVYRLELLDPRPLKGWVDERLTFVPAAQVPPMPSQIRDSALSNREKRLLYAEWLSTQDQGAWKLEAVQQVAPHADGGAVRAWLED